MHNFKVFDQFEDGINEIKSIIPNITAYIGEATDETSVIANLMECIKESIPSVLDPDFPSTYAFSISASEVGFKTKGFYSFGWKIFYDRETKEITYSFRVSIRHYFKNENEFAKLGWDQRPITHYYKHRNQENEEQTKKQDNTIIDVEDSKEE